LTFSILVLNSIPVKIIFCVVIMDTLLLSRIQFGLSLSVHFIFPATTLGLILIILILETYYIIKKDALFLKLSSFLIRILALVFALGVATGILLPLSFGTNWSEFSKAVGGILGIQLAIESISAFTLESVFLAVMLFGRKRVSSFIYWLSVLLVFIGSHLSAFWILSANSWMQTPAGYKILNNQLVLDNLFTSIFNPSSGIRFLHTVTSGWITGAVFTGAIASYYLLKGKSIEIARKLLTLSIIILIITSLIQPVLGHFHNLEVSKYQPEKEAAYEGIFNTQAGSPLIVFGIPDEKHERINFEFSIPKLTSFLETGDFNSVYKGLKDYPKEYWPSVNIVFTTFHLMVFVAAILVLAGVIGLILLIRKKLFITKWFQIFMIAIVPMPYLANEMGWLGAEIGRQPWVVYGILKTSQGASTSLSGFTVMASLLVLSIIYIILLTVFIVFLFRMIRKGPAE